ASLRVRNRDAQGHRPANPVDAIDQPFDGAAAHDAAVHSSVPPSCRIPCQILASGCLTCYNRLPVGRPVAGSRGAGSAPPFTLSATSDASAELFGWRSGISTGCFSVFWSSSRIVRSAKGSPRDAVILTVIARAAPHRLVLLVEQNRVDRARAAFD